MRQPQPDCGQSLEEVEEPLQRARQDTGTAASAREELVRAHQALVFSIARKYSNRGLPFPDLVQEGNIGLIKAADKYG